MSFAAINYREFRQRLKRLTPLRPVIPVAGIIAVAIAINFVQDLSSAGRWSLTIFCSTVILWTLTRLNTSYVALVAALTLVLTGAIPQKHLFQALGDEIVWLMIGAFILGDAIQKTGLSARMTQFILGRVKTVAGLFWMLTALVIPLSFLIPSTSGRAAVTLPIYRSVTARFPDTKISRGLAILIPTIILVSTIVSLVGAGSHLIANELLMQMTQQHISFGQWALYGLPFGIATSFLSCGAILYFFLDRKQRQQPLQIPIDNAAKSSFSRSEYMTLFIAIGMLSFWLTEGVHGLKIATVSILGAVLLAMPKVGVMNWKEAVNSVSWNLIIFVSAALVLGRSLVQSGASKWVIDHTFHMSGISNQGSQILVLAILTAIALTSHIYMTSHAARAVALVPAFLSVAATLNLNPVAVMFIGTLGMDYCLTMPVSSKALLIYQDGEEPRFSSKDLLRLSTIMIPVHLGLVIVFYLTYWHWIGLKL
ncbi:SLC13 family permease [Microcoleus sp. herbarium19]|uniref:SLC13 family permease n=1 Tax=unclassified Microcoleus TaxID=2642155 RepID=UPI002FD365B2